MEVCNTLISKPMASTMPSTTQGNISHDRRLCTAIISSVHISMVKHKFIVNIILGMSKSESFLSKSSSKMNVLNVILCLLTTHTMMIVAIERMIPRMAVMSVPVRVEAQQQHFCNRFMVSGLCLVKSQSVWNPSHRFMTWSVYQVQTNKLNHWLSLFTLANHLDNVNDHGYRSGVMRLFAAVRDVTVRSPEIV